MSCEIYFVRHAQPDTSGGYNPEFPLTAQGRQDSEIVTSVLCGKGITAIYSSSYLRAVQTVSGFAKKSGLSICKEYDLRERGAGKWQEVSETYLDFVLRQISETALKAPDGENMQEVQKRCMKVLERIIKAHDGESIAVGIHGMALASILMYYHPEFSQNDFSQIINLLPFVLRIVVEGGKIKEHSIELAIKRIYPDNYL